MNRRPASSRSHSAGLRWHEASAALPPRSGIYLTRNSRGQAWFKYFDASYCLWYMSWAEAQTHPPRNTPHVAGPELAEQVSAWAHCSSQQWHEHARRQPVQR